VECKSNKIESDCYRVTHLNCWYWVVQWRHGRTERTLSGLRGTS